LITYFINSIAERVKLVECPSSNPHVDPHLFSRLLIDEQSVLRGQSRELLSIVGVAPWRVTCGQR
jgi:hypothetical protein